LGQDMRWDRRRSNNSRQMSNLQKSQR